MDADVETKTFENEYMLTHELTKEYVYQILYKRIIIAAYVIAVAGVFLFVLINDDFSYAMLAVAIICTVVGILSPLYGIKSIEDLSKRLHNGATKKTHIVFGDNITMEEGKTHLEFSYSQIQKVVETKHLIALMIGKYNSVLVAKDGFTKGTSQGFLSFVEEKRAAADGG